MSCVIDTKPKLGKEKFPIGMVSGSKSPMIGSSLSKMRNEVGITDCFSC